MQWGVLSHRLWRIARWGSPCFTPTQPNPTQPTRFIERTVVVINVY